MKCQECGNLKDPVKLLNGVKTCYRCHYLQCLVKCRGTIDQRRLIAKKIWQKIRKCLV